MRYLAILAACLLAGVGPERLYNGLDHIPIAVRDLAQARADYEKLGFVVKPGRPHDDGITNVHVKFLDRTELELISAARPTDHLAAEYADFLRGGDGPAFWSIRALDMDRATQSLQSQNLSPHYDGSVLTFSQAGLPHRLFYANSGPSPTDKPEYFAHPNTAFHLYGIWLSADGVDHTPRMLSIYAGIPLNTTPQHVCTPFSGRAIVVGDPANIAWVLDMPKRPPERGIIGATVLVHSLAAARAVLLHNHVPFKTLTCSASLWVPPGAAHGAWLEFRER